MNKLLLLFLCVLGLLSCEQPIDEGEGVAIPSDVLHIITTDAVFMPDSVDEVAFGHWKFPVFQGENLYETEATITMPLDVNESDLNGYITELHHGPFGRYYYALPEVSSPDVKYLYILDFPLAFKGNPTNMSYSISGIMDKNLIVVAFWIYVTGDVTVTGKREYHAVIYDNTIIFNIIYYDLHLKRGWNTCYTNGVYDDNWVMTPEGILDEHYYYTTPPKNVEWRYKIAFGSSIVVGE